MRILVVEDDPPLANFVRKGLEAEHYAVDVAADGEQARQMALESDYDLMVLDLNLPKLDGISVLNSVRPKKPSLPVLVLTARSRIEDRVQTLDSGADDCLTKPFSFTELAARVRALLRRGPRTVETVLRVADLELDRVARRVERAGKRIELTSKEFALLEYLMRNSGRRVTRAMIVEHVWNLSFDTSTNIVDVYINYQRSVSSLHSELQTADSSLNSAVTALQSAISSGVEGANGTLSQQDRQSLAQQVSGVTQQVLSVANLNYNGHYLFAGTADAQPPFVQNSDGTISYKGNDHVNSVEIETGQSVAVNQPGSALFGASGAGVFQALNDLTTALQDPNATSEDIGNATTELRTAYDQLDTAESFYGNTIDQLVGAQYTLNNENVQLSQEQNSTVGVDMNVAVTNLTNAEESRQATVQAAATIDNLSLMDYLSSVTTA